MLPSTGRSKRVPMLLLLLPKCRARRRAPLLRAGAAPQPHRVLRDAERELLRGGDDTQDGGRRVPAAGMSWCLRVRLSRVCNRRGGGAGTPLKVCTFALEAPGTPHQEAPLCYAPCV